MRTPDGSSTSTAMTGAQFARSHPKGMGASYWHVARTAILRANLRKELQASGRVLDIGCGPGVVVEQLRAKDVDCWGVDLGTPEAESAALSPYLFLGKKAGELPVEFRRSVTTVLLMDVLEHLPEPLTLLNDCYQDFPNAQTVYVTVPARMEVWSAWDEFFGHYRRYTRESLASLIAESRYTLEDSAYFFHSLYLAMRAMAVFSKERSTKTNSPRARIAHSVLGRLLVAEQQIAPGWLAGSSLYAVLRRTDTPRQ